MRVKLMDWQRVNRYSNPQAKSGRIFEERGKWYMSIVFEVDAVEIITDGKGIGVDRNVGQVADSTGKIWYLTDTSHQVKRVKKLQKRLSRRTRGSQRYGKLLKTIGRHQRELANLRKNDLRHICKGNPYSIGSHLAGRFENQKYDSKCQRNGREPWEECEAENRTESSHPRNRLGAVGTVSK